jgi:glutathione synthase/RimK-type ligase-like ATP-grasp enzyme
MTALLWGVSGDATMASVRRAVQAMGVPHLFLDQRDVATTTVEMTAGEGVGGFIRTPGRTLDLAEVSAFYLRPHDGTRVTPDGSDLRRHARAVDDTLAAFADLSPALVISRPSAAAANGSKPAQSYEIAACGFQVPPTLVTNHPGAVAEFARRHGNIIYKSTSGVRSQVRRLDPDDAGRLAAVTVCPTQFQGRVPGTDVRVHVIGAQVFATEITSDADDYRYATRQGLPRPVLAAIDLPDDVAERCRRLAARLALPVAGIDLRVTPDGQWYCFEANPSPGFSYYEAGTGQPLAAAVAGLVAAAVTCAEVPR